MFSMNYFRKRKPVVFFQINYFRKKNRGSYTATESDRVIPVKTHEGHTFYGYKTHVSSARVVFVMEHTRHGSAAGKDPARTRMRIVLPTLARAVLDRG